MKKNKSEQEILEHELNKRNKNFKKFLLNRNINENELSPKEKYKLLIEFEKETYSID